MTVKGIGVWGDTISSTIYTANGDGVPVDVRWVERLADHPFIEERFKEIAAYIAAEVAEEVGEPPNIHTGSTASRRDGAVKAGP